MVKMNSRPEINAVREPGYHRTIRVIPAAGQVTAMLEDDMHCMGVTLRHDGESVLAVEPVTQRAPWDTCPGAAAKLIATVAGLPLRDVTARRDKQQNCTHLHDLAVLAAAHAGDTAPMEYQLSVSDPVDARRMLEIRRDGSSLHRWTEQGGTITDPPAIAGRTLFTLRDWIAGLDGEAREAARLLQWGAIVAHGRTIPIAQQSRASDIPPNCYTFQPERAVHARRIGALRDFSDGVHQPLADSGAALLPEG